MMEDLTSILECIKKRFAESHLQSFEETFVFDEYGGVVTYPTFVEFEILGAFIEKDHVKVVVIIKRFECHENVLDFMIKNFQEKIQKEIIEQAPAAEDCVDIIPVKPKGLKIISEYTFEI